MTGATPRPARRRRRTRLRVALLVLAAASLTAGARAQVQTPPAAPLDQEELRLQGRSSVTQGAGARAFGMGGAFLARADDATAASWNPAGLSYLRLPELSVVGTFEDSTRNKLQPGGARLENDHGHGQHLGFFSVAFPVELGSVKGAVQVNYQRVIGFNDREIDRANTSIRSAGGLDIVALGSGLQISRSLRLGATLNRWYRGYQQTLTRTPLRDTGDQLSRTLEMSFDLTGWNGHAGVIWSPWESLNLGGVIKTGFTGNVTFKRARWDLVNNDLTTRSTNAFSRSDVQVKMPPAFGLGASWRPQGTLTLSLDYTRTYWSRGVIKNYFQLRRANVGESVPEPTAPADLFDQLPYPLLQGVQNDTEQIRAGGEYVVVGQHLRWPLRLGFYSDRTYYLGGNVQSPRLLGATFGTGLVVGSTLFDVAYVYEWGAYPDTDEVRNRVTLRTHRVVVSLIYRHRAH